MGGCHLSFPSWDFKGQIMPDRFVIEIVRIVSTLSNQELYMIIQQQKKVKLTLSTTIQFLESCLKS